MGLIDGRPLYNNEETLEWVPEEKRPQLAYSFVDVLADLHAIEPKEVGLENLGKPDSYVGRQLKTWYRSWTSSIESADYDDPRAKDLQEFFVEHLPEQKKLSIVHGDYGLHNCLIGADSFIAAVVDWEISTLGDPLADLAYAINAFPDSSDKIPISLDAATAVKGFPERYQLAKRYEEKTKTDLSNLDYYTGFNRWKSACIVQGLYARYMAGQKSSEGIDLEHMRERINIALTLSEQAVNRLTK